MTKKNIDPKKYGLSKRLIICKSGTNNITIVIKRKSRIIMKDGIRILKIAKKITQVEKNKKISVRTSAPVCSKTKDFLIENKIPIKNLNGF